MFINIEELQHSMSGEKIIIPAKAAYFTVDATLGTSSAVLEDFWRLRFIPFNQGKFPRRGINDYGRHIFLGRSVFDDGYYSFVTLTALGSASYMPNLETVLEDLCSAVREGRDVLLSISPGRDEPKGLAPRTYEPHSPEDLMRLRTLYSAIPEMKQFPDPFENQPSCVNSGFMR